MIDRINAEHIVWIDYLKAIAIITVVVLHVSVPVLSFYGDLDINWWLSTIFDSIMRFCVPVFLMITGVLILGKEIQLNIFLKKRFLRIIYPFLFWNSLYILHNYITGNISLNFYFIKWVGDKYLHGASFHLWYIYLIIGIYLFIPIINRWIRNCKFSEISFFLFLWAITLSFNLPMLEEFKPSVDLSYFAGYLGYVVMGYYLFQRQINPGFWKSFLIFMAGMSITAAGIFFTTVKKGKFDTSFYYNLTPNVALASVGMFLMVKNIKIKHDILNESFFYLSRHSLGIYLMHMFVYKLLLISGINWEIFSVVMKIILQSTLCIVISCLLIFFIRKIPYGKYISG